MKRWFILAAALLSALSATAQSAKVMALLARQYDHVYLLDGTESHPLILVSRGGNPFNPYTREDSRCGFVDMLGKVVIPLKYNSATRFQHGLSVVHVKGKEGVINSRGEVVVPVEWDHIGPFSHDVTVAYKLGEGDIPEFSLIDTTGRATTLPYDYCDSQFSNGYLIVGHGTYSDVSNVEPPAGISRRKISFTERFEGKFGYIAVDGTEAIPVQYDGAHPFDRHRLAAVAKMGKYYNKWGLVNELGNEVVAFNFYSISGFSNGRAIVSRIVEGRQMFGYIDVEGREVIECRYVDVAPFKFANTWVTEEVGGENRYRLIDSNGNNILDYEVYELQDNGEYGYAVAVIRDARGAMRYGIVSYTGHVIVPFDYDRITIFTDHDPALGGEHQVALLEKGGQSQRAELKRATDD